jgi:hypothetical protein
VDEGAQLAGDLTGPNGLWIGLGGVLAVPEYAGCAKLVADALEAVVAVVPVMDDHGTPVHAGAVYSLSLSAAFFLTR